MNDGSSIKRSPWLLSGGLALLVALWLLSGVFSETGDSEPVLTADAGVDAAADSPSSVRVRSQKAESVQRHIVVNGKTAPARTVTLAAETDGRVESTGLDRGRRGEAGTVIAQLDDRGRLARIAEAKAMLSQREAEYEAREKLKSSSYVSEAQLKEALALLEAGRAELLRAELDLEYARITAPFDGALLERHVEVGDFLSRGDPVATWVDDRRIVVSANLSEHDAGYVKVGDSAEARLATGETVRGTIRFVAPVANDSTRTFDVELEVDNQDGALRAGGTAELRIPAETVLAHLVPPSLLTLDDAGNVGVKIVTRDDKVRFVVADVALSDSDGVWLAGLPEEATIITVGQGYVADGAAVSPVPEDADDTALAAKGDEDL